MKEAWNKRKEAGVRKEVAEEFGQPNSLLHPNPCFRRVTRTDRWNARKNGCPKPRPDRSTVSIVSICKGLSCIVY